MLKNPQRLLVNGSCVGLVETTGPQQGDLYFTENSHGMDAGFFVGADGPFIIQSFKQSMFQNGVHTVSEVVWEPLHVPTSR